MSPNIYETIGTENIEKKKLQGLKVKPDETIGIDAYAFP